MLKGEGKGDSCHGMSPRNPHSIPSPLFFKRLSSPPHLAKCGIAIFFCCPFERDIFCRSHRLLSAPRIAATRPHPTAMQLSKTKPRQKKKQDSPQPLELQAVRANLSYPPSAILTHFAFFHPLFSSPSKKQIFSLKNRTLSVLSASTVVCGYSDIIALAPLRR